MNDWNIWDSSLHEIAQQKQKQKKAVSSDCKPIKILPENKSGEFASPRTGEMYNTSLDNCTCVNFSREHLPCKHMYRLAYELGLMTPPAELSYAYAKPEALNLFDTVSQEAARLFVYRFSDTSGKYFKFEDSPALQELVKIGFVEICEDEDIITDIQLSGMTKDVLLTICSKIDGCPKKSSKKQAFIDFIKSNMELLKFAATPPLCVRTSSNIGNLYNTIKAAYHRKYPSENSSYWVTY